MWVYLDLSYNPAMLKIHRHDGSSLYQVNILPQSYKSGLLNDLQMPDSQSNKFMQRWYALNSEPCNT